MAYADKTGNNTTYGVFTAYYLENNYFNASIHDYAWVGGLSVAVALSLAPLANWLTQVSNYRVPLLIGEHLAHGAVESELILRRDLRGSWSMHGGTLYELCSVPHLPGCRVWSR
jgi:hypothetical protein